MLAQVAEGAIRIFVQRTYPLESAATALASVAAGGLVSKLGITTGLPAAPTWPVPP